MLVSNYKRLKLCVRAAQIAEKALLFPHVDRREEREKKSFVNADVNLLMTSILMMPVLNYKNSMLAI